MNSTQSGTVNISIEVANPTVKEQIPLQTPATMPLPITPEKYQQIPQITFSIIVIFGLLLHYLMTSYAVNDLLFPLHRNYKIPQKGGKLTIWKARTFPLLIAILTGLYGLIMARTIAIILYNIAAWYLVFIEYIIPKISPKSQK